MLFGKFAQSENSHLPLMALVPEIDSLPAVHFKYSLSQL